MEILLASCGMFAFVFLKAFQQRNVAFDHYMWVIPLSLLMATVEVYVISVVVRFGYDLALVAGVGLGGGIGAVCAMFLHKKLLGGPKE